MSLLVRSSAIDRLGRFVSEITCYVPLYIYTYIHQSHYTVNLHFKSRHCILISIAHTCQFYHQTLFCVCGVEFACYESLFFARFYVRYSCVCLCNFVRNMLQQKVRSLWGCSQGPRIVIIIVYFLHCFSPPLR